MAKHGEMDNHDITSRDPQKGIHVCGSTHVCRPYMQYVIFMETYLEIPLWITMATLGSKYIHQRCGQRSVLLNPVGLISNIPHRYYQ